MIGGKPGKYCKISVYLEHNAPSLYQNINDLCLFGALNTRRGRGVTFIIPNRKTQGDINKATNKEPNKAVNMIKNLIVTKYLENPNDYMKEYTPVSNKGKALDIKSVSSKEVTLSNGTKITKIPNISYLNPENRTFSVMQASGDVVVQDMPSDFETKQGGYFMGGAVRKNNIVEKNYYQIKCFIKSHIKFSDKSPEPLTNYLCVYKEEPLVKCTFNGSPLSALFLYPLVKGGFGVDHQASNMKSLFEFQGYCNITEEKKVRVGAVNTADAANIVGKIRERYDACWEKCKDIHSYFTDKEAFINWSMAKDEFCLLHTENYINAIKNSRETDFLKIFHCFENYVRSGLITKNYQDCLHLTKPNIDSIGNIPLFCRRIELLISSVSFCGCSMGEILEDTSFVDEYDNPSKLRFCKRDLGHYVTYLNECGCY